MSKQMKWVSLFSQTGSEICEVSKRLNRWPDVCITNQQDIHKINNELFNNTTIHFTDPKPTVEDYDRLIPCDSFVTLNGWLRVLPAVICEHHTIFNGHPGLITKYPELKGKDPQERAFEAGHKVGGCVIHRVIPEVDEGQILSEGVISIEGLTLDDVYDKLHEVSINLWVDFLGERL